MKEIKIGDYVYTFVKKDREPVDKRKVVKITETQDGKEIEVKPTFDSEYHSGEETIIFKIEDVYIDVEDFKTHLTNCRNNEIKEIDNLYKKFLENYKLGK